jgi:hypothetical protein
MPYFSRQCILLIVCSSSASLVLLVGCHKTNNEDKIDNDTANSYDGETNPDPAHDDASRRHPIARGFGRYGTRFVAGHIACHKATIEPMSGTNEKPRIPETRLTIASVLEGRVLPTTF